MFEMTSQPTVRRVPAARFQHPVQFGFQLSGSGPHAVLGDLAPLLAVAQFQPRLKQMLDGSWEGPRRRRSELRHLPAPLQQMGQATLMERELESVVGRPAVVNQKPSIFGSENHPSRFVPWACPNGVYVPLRPHPL